MRRTKIRRRRLPGPPPSADPDTLADVAIQLLGSPARSYEHATVSGYKEATAYVIWLVGPTGRPASIVFKDVRLSPEHYPAVVGFPGRPGLPEAAMYDAPTAAIERFLPHAHAHVELAPGEHYQYFLEDLNTTHRFGFNHGDILWAVDRLLEVSDAIGEWVELHPEAPIIRYDGDFPTTFLEYARDALRRFGERTGDARVDELMERWDVVAKVYLDETPDEADDGVHGDYRRDNLFHDRKDLAKMKVVDWEFSGRGWIHNDLVSLLKTASPETVESALGRIGAARPGRSREEHRRLYERCRLERGLLDSALVANQRLAKSETPTLNDSHFARIRSATEFLSDGSNR